MDPAGRVRRRLLTDDAALGSGPGARDLAAKAASPSGPTGATCYRVNRTLLLIR